MYPDGTSYDAMDAAHTTNWTKVLADPWATDKVFVDLTAPVTVGLWCNSDWTQGTNPSTGLPYATDPAYCRSNGTVAPASAGISAANGDYAYPWVPPGITLDGTSSVALSIAYSKVEVDGSGLFRPRDSWRNPSSADLDPKLPKWFYENDNVLWCDATSGLFPQGGTPQPQVCQNSSRQTCDGKQQQCTNTTAQQCQGLTPQTCSAQSQSCGNVAPQSCVGAANQTCDNITSQRCDGMQSQTCEATTDTSQCTISYDPPGCNLCTKECGTCTLKTDCPVVGKCSTTGASCTLGGTCPNAPGVCSTTGTVCTSDASCGAAGRCSIEKNKCTSGADCPPRKGSCTLDKTSCADDTQCGSAGFCSINGNVCSPQAGCASTAGTCSATGADCSSSTQCPALGRCSVQTSATCTSDQQCPRLDGVCSVDKSSCVTSDPSGPGTCPLTNYACSITGLTCTPGTTSCPTTKGTCSITRDECTIDGGCAPVTSASASATCTDLLADGSGSLFADAANEGRVCRRNNKDYAGVSAGRYNYPDAKYNFPVTGGMGPEVPYFDDSAPAGATTYNLNESNWIGANPTPHSGTRALRVQVSANPELEQAYFFGATAPMVMQPGDFLYVWVYLDPANPPREIMLQWFNGNDWGRAYWGEDLIPWGGAVDNPAHRFAGPLPAAGRWTRLTVPASLVGAEGASISGIAFTPSNGVAFFDVAGRAASALYSSSVVDACSPTPRFTSVARHYWKTSVEWCHGAVAGQGDQWLGYGSADGSCQPFRDEQHLLPRFYRYGADPGTDNVANPAFQRVDLDISKRGSAQYTHTWKDDTGTAQTVTRSFDEEMTNYANWFVYYRTRIQAVKTVTSLAFKELDTRYRVGLHTLSNNTPGAPFLPVADFGGTQKNDWYSRLNAIRIQPGQETPTLHAIQRVGEYYRTGGSGELSGTDPIVLSCQKNWHMLFTDGLTNQSDPPKPSLGNWDKLVPNLPVAVPGLTPGAPWPTPYREGATAVSDSAADYTTFYWVTDLRTSGAAADNTLVGSERDPATWQHVNFAAMSLGTEGKLPAGNQSVTEDALRTGALSWPTPYPNVYQPDESGVDDLWHAAINGRGRFVNAQTADELKLGMGQILQDITNQAGARNGVAFQDVNLTTTNRYAYRARFEPGWAGSLTKLQIDPSCTLDHVGPCSTSVVWSASDQLTAQLTVVPGVKDTPWFTERRIVTMDATGKAVPFRWEYLSTAQQDSLAPGKPKRSAAIMEFLRGNRTNEGTKLNQLRVRAGVLGDIVDSQPVYVGAPSAPYLEANDPGYALFTAANANRAARIYVGANDGMLHAFDDATGSEAWAFVPGALYRADDTGLGALAYQDGALPPFRHHYYVDSTPRVVDVRFGAGDWRSLLVGGLGKGGRSYYAIDVTRPSDFTTEADVAKKVLWEFTDPDLGYTYGKPVVTKTRAFGGRWVVILPSGYNNVSPGSGEGKIFFVDAATGQLLYTMSTSTGSAGTPSGLGHIAGYTQDYRNQLTEQVYGGDLLGNFWRFDVSSPDTSKWTVAKLAELRDPERNAPQPVTTPPQIEIDTVTAINRWVFVGTGKLYDDSDLADTQVQTLYALRDGTVDAPAPFPQPLTRSVLKEVASLKGVEEPATGWYDDLPAGQRVVVPPQAALSVVAYVGTSPQTDPCLTGQPATIYARSYSGGASMLLQNHEIVESVTSPEGGVGLEILSLSPDGGDGSGTTGGAGGVPTLALSITLGTSGENRFAEVALNSLVAAHRMSWRLLSD